MFPRLFEWAHFDDEGDGPTGSQYLRTSVDTLQLKYVVMTLE